MDKNVSTRCRCKIMKGRSEVARCQFVIFPIYFLLFPFPLFALGFLKRPELRPYPSRNDFDSTSFIENGFPQASKSADDGLSLIIAFLDNFC